MIPDRATHLFRGYRGHDLLFELWVDAAPYGERSGSYVAELAACKSRLAKGELSHVNVISLGRIDDVRMSFPDVAGTMVTLTKADTEPGDILT